MIFFLRTLSVFFVILSFGFSFGPSPILVDVNKPVVETGEVFIYTVKIEGFFYKPVLIIPDFNNLRVVSQGQSKSYALIDGKQKLLMTFNFNLFADKPGVFKIEPSILEDNDKRYKSKVITIKVTGRPLKEKMKIQPYVDSGTVL